MNGRYVRAVLVTALALLLSLGAGQTALAGQYWKTQVGSGGDDGVTHVAVDGGSNVLLTYYWNEATGIYESRSVVKTGPTGQVLWQKQMQDGVLDIATDPSGNVFLLTDEFNGLGDDDGSLIKLGADGTMIWKVHPLVKYWYQPTAMATDRDGNVVVVARESNSSFCCDLPWLKKFSPSGDLLWKIDTVFMLPKAMAVDHAGNIMISGSGPYPDDESIVAKYNADGELLWSTSIDESVPGFTDVPIWQINALTTDDSGNVIVTGWTGGGFPAGQPTRCDLTYCAWAGKFSSNGDLLWSRVVSTQSQSYAVASSAGGQVVIGGFADRVFNTTPNLPWLWAYSSDGTPLGGRSLQVTGGTGNGGSIRTAAIDASGNVIFGGSADGSVFGPYKGGGSDGFIAKFKP